VDAAVRALAVGLLAVSCAKKPAPCAGLTLEATHAATPPTLDGKLEEELWHKTPDTGALREASAGPLVVTHTEVRVLWDDKALYIGWYAADEDIGSSDVLEAELNGKRFEVRPTTHTPTVEVDSDGSLDNPLDDDEEWTAELVVPWSALGLAAPPETLAADFRRVDQPKHSQPRHQRWNAQCPGPGTLHLKR
jgi:hypothetical protein